MNKNKKKTEKAAELDPKKKKLMIAVSVSMGVFLVLLVAFAVIYPLASINSDFDRLISDVEGMNAPTVVITDMLADNIFSDSSGEVMINEEMQTKNLLGWLCDAAAKMKYSGKDTDAFSSWGIRLTVTDGEKRAVLYLSEDGMYYSVGSVEYHFAPKNGDDEKDYEKLYGEVCRLLGKTEIGE